MGTKRPKEIRRFTISIPEEYAKALEDAAEDLEMTLSEAVREAVATYLMEHYWKDTIGGAAEKAIRAGKSNDETLSIVRKQFPRSAASLGSIRWYRSKLRKKFGEDAVPTDRQARDT